MLEPATPNLIPDCTQQSLLMMNQNLKFQKSLTPRLTNAVVPASYCILSVGQGIRALMKKLTGYSPLNLDTLLNSLQTSRSFPVFFIFWGSHFFYVQTILILYLLLSHLYIYLQYYCQFSFWIPFWLLFPILVPISSCASSAHLLSFINLEAIRRLCCTTTSQSL